ncbi:hypothetical protein SteCoe_11206 [Stentor coeruleus]|uniref:RRM domain-containing protein n=1 Tax=Stentor coeruleus TaxID=5963 RepID=A0A1R2CDQ6_9CILI|nr:hypothetical protein SteCoe_11206 [Stentor coeruleus]
MNSQIGRSVQIGGEVYSYSDNRMSHQQYVEDVYRQIEEVAKLSVAEEHRNLVSIRKNADGKIREFNVCCSSTKHFSQYSLGLRLHFMLVQQLIIIFAVIAGVSILPLYLNYKQNYYLPGQVQSQLDFFTIGNQGEYLVNNTRRFMLDIHNDDDIYLSIYVSDGCYSGFFILMILIFFIVANVQIMKDLKGVHKISDYSLEIKGIPRTDVTEDEVKEHFSKFGEVAEVFLGRRYGDLLFTYTERARLEEEINLLTSLDIKNEKDPNEDKKLQKLKNQKAKFDEKISKNLEIRKYEDLEIKRVYVVFNKQADKKNCLKIYSRTNCCGCRLQKKKLRFRKKHKLTAFLTKEPTDIIWENIEVGKSSRCCRFLFSMFLTLFVLLASIGMIYYVKVSQKKLPTQAQCALNSEDYEKFETYCECQKLESEELIKKSTGDCADYFKDLTNSWGMKFLSSFGIIFMNFFVKLIMRKLSSFEKPKSQTEIQTKIFKKIFILMFINTAILPFLVNLNAEDLSKYIFKGSFSDFEREWFLKVGNLILTLMIISLGSPHLIYLFIAYPLGWCSRKFCYKSKKTQYELNLLYTGPDFDISTRTAMIFNMIFTCFLYSGGIPLLNCVCFIYLIIIYYTDKFLMLRHFKRPPFYTQEIYIAAFQILPWAVIFHCMVSLFMYGNNEIFKIYTKENKTIHNIFGDVFGARVEKPAGIVLIFLVLSGLVLIFTMNFIEMIFGKLITKISKSKNEETEFKDIRNELRRTGLDSYDIRMNPDYAKIIQSVLNSEVETKRLIDDQNKTNAEDKGRNDDRA